MADDQQKIIVNVDLDRISAPAVMAVRRAYVFSGFSINSACRPDASGFHLPGKMQFRFVGDTENSEMTEEYKTEFMLGRLEVLFVKSSRVLPSFLIKSAQRASRRLNYCNRETT